MKISKEKVRDGYFRDLPSDLQKKILEINKLIVDTVKDLVDDDHYEDLKSSRWAMSCIDDFCVTPDGSSDVGSARVYESKYRGKLTYKCMIQVTGHFTNHQTGWIEMLLHELFQHVYSIVRPIIRRKYDIKLDSEGGRGESFEGFDIYPDKKVAADIWSKFEDKTTKTLTEEGLLLDGLGNIIFEGSHSKLKYDFRMGFDYNTGHAIKIVYSLDGAKIDMAGGAYKKDEYGNKKSPENLNHRSSDEVTSQVSKTIAKKGDLDHASHGQKVLAIVDRVTNENLKSAKVVGLFYPHVRNSFNRLELTRSDFKYLHSRECNKDDFPIIKVGEVDLHSSFKSTKYFRGNQTAINFEGEKIDRKSNKVSNAEHLKYGRGAKMDDITKHGIDEPIFNHPSKKDKRDNPDLYENKCIDETLEEGFFSRNQDNVKTGSIEDLPYGFVNLIKDIRATIRNSMYNIISDNVEFSNIESVDIDYLIEIIFNEEDPSYGYVFLQNGGNNEYAGNVTITAPLKFMDDDNRVGQYISIFKKIHQMVWNELHQSFNNENPGKILMLSDNNEYQYFCIDFTPEYAEKLWNYMENPRQYPLTESSSDNKETPYDTDMSETEAKKVLENLASQIIRDTKDGKENINQYKANTIANIISRNLLPIWSKGFNKFSIILGSYQSFPTLEFKVPKIETDFIQRFIDGRESLSGLVHRNHEIKVKMSPRVFHTMKSPSDCWHFFQAAIQYFDHGLDKASEKLMYDVMRFDKGLRELVCTTNLSGLVTIPMKLLFVWDSCDMSNKNSFKLPESDIRTISQFMQNIRTRYSAPENEQKAIINDVKEMIKELHENCEMDDNMKIIDYLPEALNEYYSGKFNNVLDSIKEKFMREQVDTDWLINPGDPQVKYLQEKFGVKKLKKIPVDTIAYITIETEAIRDANDKMMIASYCLGKLEIVEWYIELLTVGSKKYIVPHNKPYLESMRTQLLACYKKIMDTPVQRPSDRPLLDIKYPKGYEG